MFYRKMPAAYRKYAVEAQRPGFAWDKTEKIRMRIEFMVTPKPGAQPHKNDWVVAIVALLPDDSHTNPARKRMEQYAKITGSVADATEGQTFEGVGKWVYEKKDNTQWNEWVIKVEGCTRASPTSTTEIYDYLLEIDNLGPIRSSALLNAWNLQTIPKLEEAWESLRGITSESDNQESWELPEDLAVVFKAAKLGGTLLIDALHDAHHKRDDFAVRQLLREALIKNTAVITKIASLYRGQNFKDAVKKNPLELQDIDGITFKQCDHIWGVCGIAPDDIRRIAAAVIEVLKSKEQEGHCWSETRETITKAGQLINLNMVDRWFTEYEAALQQHIAIDENGNIWRRRTMNTEASIADRLHTLMAHPGTLTDAQQKNLGATLDTFTAQDNFVLSDEQKAAALGIFRHRLSVLAGSAGTGKTTIVKYIIKLAYALYLDPVLIMAPTGAAARRASRATGSRCTTIHRGLGLVGGGSLPYYDENEPLDCKMIVVDETSMIDLYLMSNILHAVRAGTHVLFVGDPKQLPAIGPGALLRDMIDSKAVPTFTLKEVRRNSGPVLRLAYSTWEPTKAFQVIDNHGRQLYEDLEFIPLDTTEKIVNEVVQRFVAIGDPNKVKALVSTNSKWTTNADGKEGYWDAGVQHLNSAIAAAMLPPKGTAEVTYGQFRVGHRCLWLKNTSKDSTLNMVNGQDFDIIDIQIIDGDSVLTIETLDDTGKLVQYMFNARDQPDMFALGYCRSINKAQGDGYETVLLVIRPREGWLSTERVYTGITRTESRCVIIGKPEKVWETKPETKNRQTGLKERLAITAKKEHAA